MASEKILIVEDEPAIRSICSRILEAEGYQIRTVGGSTEALLRLDEEGFDLLLTDVRLPGMTGLELARKLRDRNLDVAVVTMTGYSNLETAIQALSLGVDEFIVKPFTTENLRRTVARALEKARLRRENARLRALMPLFENTRAFVSAASPEQLRAHIVQAVTKTIRTDAVALLEADAESQTLNLVAAHGDKLAMRIGEAIPFTNAQARILQTIDQVQIWRDAEIEQLPLELGAYAGTVVIGAGLLVGGKRLGYLLARASANNSFSVSDAEALTIVAGQAAVALENARLIGELRNAYQELQDLDRLKNEFINITAHELRTPLAVLMGYAVLMVERLRGEEREQMQYVLTNAERLRYILDEMFSLRYLELGQAELRLETFDVNKALSAVADAYRSLAIERDQLLVVQLAPMLGEITADHSMLDLMVGNLLSNAIKFSARNSSIEIEAWSESNQVTIVVRDHGRGLTLNEQEHVFERFYQASNSLTREQGGLGLGLSITRSMVLAHHGKIWVESEQGKGSAFYISLPCHAEPAVVYLREAVEPQSVKSG